MSISTNSIIHYTDSLEKLESILDEGFRIKYCGEKLRIDDKTGSFAAHPMICFCDIPLSQSHQHFSSYGRYGIGLSKNWAKRVGINPVIYLDERSSISKTLGMLLKERRKEKTNLTKSQKYMILRLKCFAKNYSGTLKRESSIKRNYKFYDEREWRLVPRQSELKGSLISVGLSYYNKNKENLNYAISSIRIGFKPSEISYIIVDKTDEIPKIINIVRDCFDNMCSESELDILLSKICSTEQIIDDY